MKTAVEWLAEKLKIYVSSEAVLQEITEQAKVREKKQIIDAREDGHLSTYAEYGSTPKCYLDGGHEQYYNETFKSE